MSNAIVWHLPARDVLCVHHHILHNPLKNADPIMRPRCAAAVLVRQKMSQEWRATGNLSRRSRKLGNRHIPRCAALQVPNVYKTLSPAYLRDVASSFCPYCCPRSRCRRSLGRQRLSPHSASQPYMAAPRRDRRPASLMRTADARIIFHSSLANRPLFVSNQLYSPSLGVQDTVFSSTRR